MGYTHSWSVKDGGEGTTDKIAAGYAKALPMLRDIAERHKDTSHDFLLSWQQPLVRLLPVCFFLPLRIHIKSVATHQTIRDRHFFADKRLLPCFFFRLSSCFALTFGVGRFSGMVPPILRIVFRTSTPIS